MKKFLFSIALLSFMTLFFSIDKPVLAATTDTYNNASDIIITPMYEPHEQVFVYNKYKDQKHAIKYSGLTVGEFLAQVWYRQYETWEVDEYGVKRRLLSTRTEIYDGDYTNFKLTIGFTGGVESTSVTSGSYAVKVRVESTIAGGPEIKNYFTYAP